VLEHSLYLFLNRTATCFQSVQLILLVCSAVICLWYVWCRQQQTLTKRCYHIGFVLVERCRSTFEHGSSHVFCFLPYLFELNPIELIWAQIKVLSCDCELCVSLACIYSLSVFSTPCTSWTESISRHVLRCAHRQGVGIVFQNYIAENCAYICVLHKTLGCKAINVIIYVKHRYVCLSKKSLILHL
jgi:hypothetical protein